MSHGMAEETQIIDFWMRHGQSQNETVLDAAIHNPRGDGR